jgi:hypothetical protein
VTEDGNQKPKSVAEVLEGMGVDKKAGQDTDPSPHSARCPMVHIYMKGGSPQARRK